MSIEAHYRIFDEDNAPAFIEVCPSPDIPGQVLLRTNDRESHDTYGQLHLDLSVSIWREVANAIIKACDDTKEKP